MRNSTIKPNQSAKESKREQVEVMFDNISSDYDFMNKMMTFGLDNRWRKRVLKFAKKEQPKTILDIATGTGDMPILLADTQAQSIIGIDISKGMLAKADQKIKDLHLENRIKTSVQDAENLTYEDYSFDLATVLYGIRNFENLDKGLKEIRRVLKENGTFIILETSVPTQKFIRWGYLIYTKKILPFIAKLFSNNVAAYNYLSTSALHFPYGEKLKEILKEVGFQSVEIHPQFFGASTIYVIKK